MPKITELISVAGALTASDVFPVVNSSTTKKITLSGLRDNILLGGAVTSNILADSAVTSAKISAGAVTNSQVTQGSLSQDRLATVAGLTAQAYGSATAIPVVTLTGQGTVSAASTAAVRSMASAAVYQPINGARFNLFRLTYAIVMQTAITSGFSSGSGTATLAGEGAGGPVSSFPIGATIPAGTLVYVTYSLLSSSAQNWYMSFGFTYA